MSRRGWIGSSLLLVSLAGAGAGLVVWKQSAMAQADAASSSMPEPMESITVSVAREREHRRMTTSIGTVLATRSITLRNELAGTVEKVDLAPGAVVEPGTVLVALDVSVEQAELKAFEAQAALAQTLLDRVAQLAPTGAASATELDRARTERDVALAQIDRIKAVIARKTVRAPFRARVGISDVHAGQYLKEGDLLTTLQGVEDAAHVDFAVAQQVAAGLRPGDVVEVSASGDGAAIPAKVVAVDARVDPLTRNAMVRARIGGNGTPAPGASVRVRVPVGDPTKAVAVPVSALRKGPEGDHVFVIGPDGQGKPRAHVRRVEAGPVLGDDVLILSGLTAGQQVAASGSFKLREDVLVAVAEVPAETARASR